MAESDVQAILLKLERIDERLRTMIEQGDDHEDRLRCLEAKPAKNWNTVVAALLSALCGGLVTLAITNSIGR